MCGYNASTKTVACIHISRVSLLCPVSEGNFYLVCVKCLCVNSFLLLLKQILKAKLVLPPYLGAEARSLLKKVVMNVLMMAFIVCSLVCITV